MAPKRVDFAYDAAGRYATITRYADLAATDEVATGTYTFDPLGRITSLIYTQPNSTGLPYYGWTYDAAGNMTWMETIDGEVDYTHDDTNQLTDADYDYRTDEEYTYDSNGNRTNTGYVTGPNNQLLTSSDGVTTYRYEYDAEGNRTLRYIDVDTDEVFDSGDTDATEYTWDYRNRLTQVEHFTTYANYDAGTSDQIVQYTYDYANRLIQRVLDPDGTSGATAVEQSIYVYENGQIVAQFDKTGTGDLAATDLSHRYLWNPQAVDQLFADEQVHYDGGFVTDELLWTLTDHLNSVRDLATYDSQTDETTIATHRIFDAFGKETSSTGSATCLLGFTGRSFDSATGLQNNLHRWYDPAVGRWLSEDPIGYWGGINLYAYCANAPLVFTDPSGECVRGACEVQQVGDPLCTGASLILYNIKGERVGNGPIGLGPNTPFNVHYKTLLNFLQYGSRISGAGGMLYGALFGMNLAYNISLGRGEIILDFSIDIKKRTCDPVYLIWYECECDDGNWIEHKTDTGRSEWGPWTNETVSVSVTMAENVFTAKYAGGLMVNDTIGLKQVFNQMLIDLVEHLKDSNWMAQEITKALAVKTGCDVK